MLLKAVTFLEDGSATFEFLDLANDLRANGLVQHRVLVLPVDAYEDEIGAMAVECLQLLRKALADFATEPAVEPVTEDEDEEPSPYDNPSERDVR